MTTIFIFATLLESLNYGQLHILYLTIPANVLWGVFTLHANCWWLLGGTFKVSFRSLRLKWLPHLTTAITLKEQGSTDSPTHCLKKGFKPRGACPDC